MTVSRNIFSIAPEKIQTPEYQTLFETMIAVMRSAPGVGLAAPQIDIPLRVIVLEDREELMSRLTPDERRERGRTPFDVRTIVNPIVTGIGEEQAAFFEGCLSVPGYAGSSTATTRSRLPASTAPACSTN